MGAARVTLIHGARQTGKTTLARQICDRLGGTFATLDDPALLAAARRDPVVHGYVLHTGPNRVSLGDRLTLLPLEALWT